MLGKYLGSRQLATGKTLVVLTPDFQTWFSDLELKLPKFCLRHVAWSLNIPPAKFHASGKSCQKQILSSRASGICRKQAKLQAAGKNCQKTNPINFFACCVSIFKEAGKTLLRDSPMNSTLIVCYFWLFLKLKFFFWFICNNSN